MSLSAYFGSLSVANLLSRMPAAAAQGMIWGLMALGVFITFRVLDIADLTVDGSFATGGAVTNSAGFSCASRSRQASSVGENTSTSMLPPSSSSWR